MNIDGEEAFITVFTCLLDKPQQGWHGLEVMLKKSGTGGHAIIQLSPNQAPQLSYALNSINTCYSC